MVGQREPVAAARVSQGAQMRFRQVTATRLHIEGSQEPSSFGGIGAQDTQGGHQRPGQDRSAKGEAAAHECARSGRQRVARSRAATATTPLTKTSAPAAV